MQNALMPALPVPGGFAGGPEERTAELTEVFPVRSIPREGTPHLASKHRSCSQRQQCFLGDRMLGADAGRITYRAHGSHRSPSA